MKGTFRGNAERGIQVYAAVAALVIFTSGFAYLCLGHWPVTHQDFWRIYDVCLNRSWLDSALLKYNGHSHFFPSQLWLADLRFFHGNVELLFIAGLTFLLLTTGLFITPVWRDPAIGGTRKLLAVLTIVAGNFWMGRAQVTASGGFNCCYSLALGGAAMSFLVLWTIPENHREHGRIGLIIVCAVLSSFSFGTGLATWPTLLFLGYCLRLRRRALISLAIAGVAAACVFMSLPSREGRSQGLLLGAHPAAMVTRVPGLFCRLIGSPFVYVAGAWLNDKKAFSYFSFFCGVAGLTLAAVIIYRCLSRRSLKSSKLEFIGSGLVAFNLIALLLIVVARVDHMRLIPTEVAAPRYLFWSTLFWTGVLLVIIGRAESIPRLRWLAYPIVLLVPVVLLPSHYKAGLQSKWVRGLAQAGAISLVNGVRDNEEITILAPATGPNQVYRVAEQFRVRRLDMFANGLQDWIGVNENSLFEGRRRSEGLNGKCKVSAVVKGDNGAPAARLIGYAWKQGKVVPRTLVIVDPTGAVCGIASSSVTYSENRFINRTLYLSKSAIPRFVGYIRGYDPKLEYAVHSADEGELSDEKIIVQTSD